MDRCVSRELLRIENLTVSCGNRIILRGINLSIKEGEVHVIFGPNGSGKSTLFYAIMGLPGYKVVSGKIYFKGQDITGFEPDRRARLGIGLAFQRPPQIRGVKLRNLLEIINNGNLKVEEIESLLNLSQLLNRDINLGFSGGEIKRSEIAQLIAQSPDLILLDEPESGVDLENIALIAGAINELLEKDKHIMERKRSAIIISHTGYILDYITADYGHVLINGRLLCTASPYKILSAIKERGYSECMKCFELEELKDE